MNKEKALGLSLISHLLLSLTESCMLSVLTAMSGNVLLHRIFSLLFTPIRFVFPLMIYKKATGFLPFITPMTKPRNTKNATSVKSKVLIYVFAVSLTVTVLNTVGILTSLFLSFFGKSMPGAAPTTSLDTVYTFIKSVCLAALLEETLLRGAALHAFSERKPMTGIVFSAILFALMHGNLYQFFYTFTAGLIIAAFTAMTGSLILAVTVHFGANLVTFVFSLLSTRLEPRLYNTVSMGVFIVFTVTSAVSAILYFTRLKREKNDTPPCFKTEGIPREILIYVAVAVIVSIVNVL